MRKKKKNTSHSWNLLNNYYLMEKKTKKLKKKQKNEIKQEFFLAVAMTGTIVWLHYLDFNEALEEKTR